MKFRYAPGSCKHDHLAEYYSVPSRLIYRVCYDCGAYEYVDFSGVFTTLNDAEEITVIVKRDEEQYVRFSELYRDRTRFVGR